ncbi:RDD family protein [Enterococcus faecalis]
MSKKNNYGCFPHYVFAGFWVRFFAFLLDLLCIRIITYATIGLFYKMMGFDSSQSIVTFYGIASLVIYLAYFVLLTKLNAGQTIGKMIFGIKVVSFEEEELSWQTILIREGICRFILKSFILLIGYLVAAFTPKKQHVGDYFSNTTVVVIHSLEAINYGKKQFHSKSVKGEEIQ